MTEQALSRLGRSLLLGAVLVLTALFLTRGGIERLDYLFYDAMVQVHQRVASESVVIVAVDDKSLRQLGRWPWPRRVHAQMVDELTELGAGTVGIDVLFSSPDRSDPEGDEVLARAIERNGNVVLVMGPESAGPGRQISEVLPLPKLARSAARLSHIDFEMDSDGICRKVFLRAGLGSPHWPAMGVAMLQQGDIHFGPQNSDGLEPDPGAVSAWVREEPILIPYAGPPGHFQRVSYVDVLEGRVSPELLRDRIVLIGATAVGLGDALSTPLSGDNTLMPGVEVNANVVAALLDGRQLYELGTYSGVALDILLVILLLVWLLLLPPRLALPGYLLTVLLTFTTSLALLYQEKLWFAPAMAFSLQSVLYILWSWLDLGQVSQLSQRLRRQMHIQSRSDTVTGLPNRAQLHERLEQLLSPEEGLPHKFGLFILNMGRHRSVIDLAGIKGNDQLHQQIARRLQRILPEQGIVYRLDGAEFAVLIDQPRAMPLLEGLAGKLVQSLLRPFQVGEEQFIINPSIGACTYPQDGAQAQELVDNAYTAMHRAGKDSSRSVRFYSSAIKDDANKQFRINQGLRNSAWKEQLTCVYQPQISMTSGRLIGVETLVRWRHPTMGEVSPAEFIPLAEREGLIVPIGNWILEQACAQGQRWRQMQGRELRMAVNVSAVQISESDVVDVVKLALAASGLPAANLELELTETAFLSHHDTTLKVLTELKELGVELAIDDFGTGYSSLSYLKDFPIDRIKIDQSFIRDVHESKESAEIARSIVNMSHGLGLGVIAEGVELPEHMDFLQDLGCDEAQGYFIGKPMTPGELETAIVAGALLLD